MAVNFEVNLDNLNVDINNARHSLEYIKNNIKRMFDEIKELDAMWDGEANESFNIQFNSDYEMMLDVCKNIERNINSMEFAKQEYAKCENSISSAVQALKF